MKKHSSSETEEIVKEIVEVIVPITEVPKKQIEKALNLLEEYAEENF